MIKITPHIEIDESEIEEQFIKSSGPGGQHVNKASTAVQLRFDVVHSSLPQEVRQRLRDLAGNRITDNGILVIEAQDSRSQRRNRQTARRRFIDLLRQAARKPKTRRRTKPTKSSQQKRLDKKKRRSRKKRLRKPPERW